MFKKGDKGVTRDGREYVVTNVDGDPVWTYPVSADVAGDSSMFTTTGLYYAFTENDTDLMPPTGNVNDVTTEEVAALAEPFYMPPGESTTSTSAWVFGEKVEFDGLTPWDRAFELAVRYGLQDCMGDNPTAAATFAADFADTYVTRRNANRA